MNQMQKKPKHLKVSGIMLGVLCMLASCGKVQTRRLYEGAIRPDMEIVKVSIPSSIRVVSINGQATQEALIEVLGNPSELHVLPGDNELGLRYTRTWDTDLSGIDRVRSDVIVVHLSAKAGETYEIRPNEKIETYRQSKKFAANPELKVTKTGEASATSAAPASILSDTVKKPGAPRPSKEAPSEPAATPDTPDTPDRPSNLEQLQQAWQNASEQERDTFIKSILKR
jgi:uncharacterized protein YccT (UPF0319 family)